YDPSSPPGSSSSSCGGGAPGGADVPPPASRRERPCRRPHSPAARAAGRGLRHVLRLHHGGRGRRTVAVLSAARGARGRPAGAARAVAQRRARLLLRRLRRVGGARSVPRHASRRRPRPQRVSLEQSGQRAVPGLAGRRGVLVHQHLLRHLHLRRQQNGARLVRLPGEVVREVPALQVPRLLHRRRELRGALRPGAVAAGPPGEQPRHQPQGLHGRQRPHRRLPRLRGDLRVLVEPRARLRRHLPTPHGGLPPRLLHPPLAGVRCRHGRRHGGAGQHRHVQPLHARLQHHLVVLLEPAAAQGALREHPDTDSPWLTGSYDPCTERYSTAYYNRRDVQMALHANVTGAMNYTWTTCSDTINTHWHDAPRSMLPIYRELIAAGLRIWVFSGDTDAVVPLTATRYSIGALGLPTTTSWHPWYDDQEVGGWSQVYKGLTLVSVRGAGHEVPLHRPRQALVLFQYFLQGKPMPGQTKNATLA
uniref:carboxypeptidase D n=1 Tax=Aegilops tauschii subsp. strangulata TaxID=200361 RepID=A0A452XY56_AEGTS